MQIICKQKRVTRNKSCNSLIFRSGYQDSNLGPPAPKAGALTGLRYIPKIFLCGEGGIRTRGTVYPYASLANWWFQPLTHLTSGL